jgi:glycosyltransferase involved in cell wall biosynthesis
MCDASVVVVALAAGSERSAGQNNYLSPMALGKLVVVTDAIGVREYVTEGETGLVTPAGDPEALAAALAWALDPANAGDVEWIAGRGQGEALERFTPDRYVASLLGVIDDVIARGD